MNIVQRSQKFGRDALERIKTHGENLATVQWIVERASAITDRLSDKRLKTCEYAGAVLDVKTTCTVCLWNIYDDPSGWLKPEERAASGWAEVREVLRELAGEIPIRTHAREREDWTSHWQCLWPRADANLRKEIIETARSRYPDFDLALLETEG